MWHITDKTAEWTSAGIYIWFFQRNAIPADITSGYPDPTGWGTPLVAWQDTIGTDSCDFATSFQSNQLVFDTTFCGVFGDDSMKPPFPPFPLFLTPRRRGNKLKNPPSLGFQYLRRRSRRPDLRRVRRERPRRLQRRILANQHCIYLPINCQNLRCCSLQSSLISQMKHIDQNGVWDGGTVGQCVSGIVGGCDLYPAFAFAYVHIYIDDPTRSSPVECRLEVPYSCAPTHHPYIRLPVR